MRWKELCMDCLERNGWTKNFLGYGSSTTFELCAVSQAHPTTHGWPFFSVLSKYDQISCPGASYSLCFATKHNPPLSAAGQKLFRTTKISLARGMRSVSGQEPKSIPESIPSFSFLSLQKCLAQEYHYG